MRIAGAIRQTRSAVVRTAELVERALQFICWVLLAILVLVVFGQVLARYVFRVAMLWGQEAALFCFAWTVFLGAGLAVRQKRHFVFDVLPENNPVVRFVSLGGTLLLSWVYFWFGLRLVQVNWFLLTQPSGFRIAYFFASIPAAGLLFIFFTAESLLRGTQPKEETDSE